MDQRLQLQQKMSQRLIMTPQMQQSIQLLQLSTLELNELLQEEMVENPLLEDGEVNDINDDASNREEFSADSTPEEKEAPPSDSSDDSSDSLTDTGRIELDENWADYFADSSDIGSVTHGASSYSESEDDDSNMQIAQEVSLKDHLLWQLGISTNDSDEYTIGEYIIDQLDENGYLNIPLEDIALTFDKPVPEIERILKIFHRFEPPGIAARTLEECLEIQCRQLEIDDDDILQVIRNHMEELERRRLKEIARALGVTEKHVQEIADIISQLDPRPGMRYQAMSNEYISPDVFVEKIDHEWQVRVSDDSAPPLRISRRYKEMLQNPDGVSSEDLDFIKKKFQSAIWLIRNIEQRKRTLYRVTRAIMDKQESFLDEGLTSMKPLKLRDIADELGIHEATVCRVVNKKYVQTPRGLFELKYFFSTGLDSTGGDDMSAKSVMEIIRNLIEDEDIKKPLSDQKITEILHRDYDLNIARRTVAKYREKMSILPTSKRKRV
ncbi:MAG: RNA polymerase factor sigma-54 [Candidatus Hinthialibacter antarcticus]|nr:RNA polymerase factor sigma-54 [Candidatus Hinthialibacter antarcticus]